MRQVAVSKESMRQGYITSDHISVYHTGPCSAAKNIQNKTELLPTFVEWLSDDYRKCGHCEREGY